MEIRIATVSEVPDLVKFNQAMALETEGKALENSVLTSGVSAVFEDHVRGFYVVAEEKDKIIGGLMITYEWSDWRNKWFWWIQSVYILPEARGRKVYSQLYEFVKKEAKKRGDVCGFRLYVEKENIHAQAVYERVGMKSSHYLMFEEEI
jgi:GNAT superfamily N-acetyltransferase